MVGTEASTNYASVNQRKAKSGMTKEQKIISNRNRRKAWNYFVSIGKIPKEHEPYEYCMHHKNEDLRQSDIERYIEWNIEDLEVMKSSEHSAHHSRQQVVSEETRAKISASLKGKAKSEESKKKMSESHKGKTLSDEHKKAIASGCTGNEPSNKGKHLIMIDGKRKYI